MQTLSHYWPFVTGIHHSANDAAHKGCGDLTFSFLLRWTRSYGNSWIEGDLRHHCMITSQWAWGNLKPLVSRLFAQPLIQVQIKENIKAPHHWPLWGESTSEQWFPSQRASNVENVSIWWCHHGHWIQPAWHPQLESHGISCCTSSPMKG